MALTAKTSARVLGRAFPLRRFHPHHCNLLFHTFAPFFNSSSSPSSSISPSSSSSSSTITTVSPAVLSRARKGVSEHSKLLGQLSDQYDTSTAKRVAELDPIKTALQAWDDASEAVTTLHTIINTDPDPDLRALAIEDLPSAIENVDRTAQTLHHALAPVHPWQQLPCLLEIRPGAGGSEAGLFANDLVKMYHQFCVKRGLSVNILKYDVSTGDSGDRSFSTNHESDTGGAAASSADSTASSSPSSNTSSSSAYRMKITLGDHSAQLIEAVLEIPSAGAYDLMRTEAGVHRVQRVPETETKGRTHTSSAAVVVLPSFPSSSSSSDGTPANPSDTSSIYYIDPKEVKVEVMRARGAGGQHVNKTESAVRLTHLPTRITVSMQDSRSQPRNKARAWQLLRSRLAARRLEAKNDDAKQLRTSILRPDRIGRENKVRTYNWQQQRVTDHRSGFTVTSALTDMLEGGDTLEKAMNSVRSWMVDNELADSLDDDQE